MSKILLGLVLVFMIGNLWGASAMEPAAEIDALIEREMRRHNLPGLAVAVTQGNRVLHLKGYGRAAGPSSITPQTQFFLASVSKSFTALAVMQLVEAGQIDLDAPVRQYLPDFTFRDEAATEQVTVRHLLNHTSGLADQGFPELRLPQEKTFAERLASLRRARPVAPPGREFHYFNSNYEVLARLVEVVSGQPFSAYLQEHIFAPLGMMDTFAVTHSSEVASRAPRLAQGHVLAYGFPLPADEMSGFIGGNGGVISTAQDVANFLIMQNRQGQFENTVIVSPESLEAMHTPPAGIETQYGMGWIERQENGQRILEHNGIFSAFYAEVALVPEAEMGVALLYNANAFPATAFAFPEIKNGLIALLTGRQPQPGGFTVVHWGLLFGGLTLAGAALALRDLLRLLRDPAHASGSSAWRRALGILWAFFPAGFLAALPWVVSSTSGRMFGYAALLRSMPEVFVWLGITAPLGLINGFLRLTRLIDRR